jgi:hypothetical protein
MAAKLACIKKRTCKKTVFIDLFKVNDQNLPRTVCTARCKFVDPDSLLPRWARSCRDILSDLKRWCLINHKNTKNYNPK